jgi:trimethylamine--corrinoid protein Co-methyltransferase
MKELDVRPKIKLLSGDLIQRAQDEALELLLKHGVRVQSAQAIELLAGGGARVDKALDAELNQAVVHIPETLVRRALETVPKRFSLYDRNGKPAVDYGGDAVHFDPGSSGVHVLDPETLEHHPSKSLDLVRIVKITEMLPQFDAQSTAIVCNDVPKSIGDLFRLFLVLSFSVKPIVTGAFSIATLQHMIDMLAIFAGGRAALAERPQAVFDVCPSPPLIWSEFGARNLIELAHARVPAQMVSMPLAGAVAPVTILGSVVQHAAECLSGIVIHQLAQPGSPIVWGGAPAIFDMRKGTTPMGAVETAMLDASYAEVGKALGLPTHTYLCASDAKIVDAQAGLESGITAMIGALAGINMISGAGMLDFLACFSPEKLVIDAEAISMVRRLLDGVSLHTETLALAMFEGIDFKGEFLKQKVTRQLFAKEQYLPSAVIDRDTIRGWQQAGSQDTFDRARVRVKELLTEYRLPPISGSQREDLVKMVGSLAREAGMDRLPEFEGNL